MFEVGFWELAVCFLVALVVLGPEKLPPIVRTLGRWTGRARVYVRNLTAELERETGSDQIGGAIGSLKQDLQAAQRAVREQAAEVKDGVRKLGDVPAPKSGDPKP